MITQVWPVCLKETPDSPKPRPLAFENHFVFNANLAATAGVLYRLLTLARGAILVQSHPRPQSGQPERRARRLLSTHTSPHSFLAAPEGDLQPLLVCCLRGGPIRDSEAPLKLRKHRGLAGLPMSCRCGPTGSPGADCERECWWHLRCCPINAKNSNAVSSES